MVLIFSRLSAEANKELRISPKKQASAKCSINAQAKTAQVRKTNSPNAKKMPTIGCKSPKKTTSPISSAADNVDNAYSSQVAQESNAIQTAKKLKRFLESNEPTASSSSQPDDMPVDEAAKRSNVGMSSTKMKTQKSHMLLKPIKKQKRAHEYQVSGDEEEKSDVKVHAECESQKEQEKYNVPEIQWTRDEDRLLLEQIKAGFDSNRQYIAEFAHRFPNKTQEHIRNRIDFLIDFLTKYRKMKK